MNKFIEVVGVTALGLVFGTLIAWGVIGNQFLTIFIKGQI